LDSKGVTNAAVVVVRYFGGTLLGVPGLIAAYKTVTVLALQLTPVLQKPVLVNYDVLFDYTLQNDVMLLVKRFGCTIQTQEMQLFCRMRLGVPLAQESDWLQKAKDMQGVEVTKVATS
jgi:putative IMPACT (imprinted ancient) family translation regulator